jgi:CubicO group peptidase (beta-lactamase class C family)
MSGKHSKDRANRVMDVAQRHCDQGNFASIEWLVLRDGKKWLRGKAGMADPANGVPLPKRPIYRLYSMTKPVISAIAMMLIEEGRLRLYEPVGAYIPSFARQRIVHEDGSITQATRPMLVEHLFTHMAGLSYGFLRKCKAGEFYRKTDMAHSAAPLAQMIETIAAQPLAFEPGTGWRYSVATDVLARIIEIVTGKPIQQVMAERVTVPLGLEDTGFMVAEGSRDRLVPAFGTQSLDDIMVFGGGPQKLTPVDVTDVYPVSDPNFGRGGYGLYSTIEDYCRIAQFLGTGLTHGGDVLLGRKSVELMWTNRVPLSMMPLALDDIPLPGFGYGLAGRVMVDPGKSWGLTSAGEFGWAGAASTWFFIDPRENLVGLVMSQYLGSKVPLADDMRNAIYSLVE